MINWAAMYHLLLFLKLGVCLRNKSWGSLLSLFTLTDRFALISLLWEISFSLLSIPALIFPRAISKHSTWKPLGCCEASWLYSALALPDWSSLSQLFGGVSALNSPLLCSRMTYMGPPGSYVTQKWQCGAEIPTVSKTESWLFDELIYCNDLAFQRMQFGCTWGVCVLGLYSTGHAEARMRSWVASVT